MADKADRDSRSARRGPTSSGMAPIDPVLQAVLQALDMWQVTTRRDVEEIENRIAAFEVKVEDHMKGMRTDVDRIRADVDS